MCGFLTLSFIFQYSGCSVKRSGKWPHWPVWCWFLLFIPCCRPCDCHIQTQWWQAVHLGIWCCFFQHHRGPQGQYPPERNNCQVINSNFHHQFCTTTVVFYFFSDWQGLQAGLVFANNDTDFSIICPCCAYWCDWKRWWWFMQDSNIIYWSNLRHIFLVCFC